MKKSWKLSETREYQTPPAYPKPPKRVKYRKKRVRRRLFFFPGGGGGKGEVGGEDKVGGEDEGTADFPEGGGIDVETAAFTLSVGGGGGASGTFAAGMDLFEVCMIGGGAPAETGPGGGGVADVAVLL